MSEVADAPEIEVELKFITPADPLFAQVEKLRWDVLIEPFDLTGEVTWDDDDPHSSHLVAVAGDRVVGYARLIEQGDVAQIRHVAVLPEEQRAGLGTVLMAALVAEARRRELAHVWLNSRMPAVRFYERLGFERVGETFYTPVVHLEHVRMELALQ